MPETIIERGARVSLHFSLALADGTLIDSNYEGQPASFVVGDESLLPGFEAVLMGRRAGDRIRVLLPQEQAFGESNPENVQRLPRSRFTGLFAAEAAPLEVGTVLSFADGSGNEIPGVVREIEDEMLVVDFNHPLAGREIRFSADILSVLPAGVQHVDIS